MRNPREYFAGPLIADLKTEYWSELDIFDEGISPPKTRCLQYNEVIDCKNLQDIAEQKEVVGSSSQTTS